MSDTMPDGQSWPRITIVTPSYNQGQFLEETIRSVLLQGYPNLEYFVIDGGSTDNSVDIIRKYADRLDYWVSEPDDGQSHAINKGFDRSTGDILAWLNSDDLYTPGALHSAAACVSANPDAALVYAQSRLWEPASDRSSLIGRSAELGALLAGSSGIPQPSAFIPRTSWTKAGPIALDYSYVMDLDYWLRLATISRLHFCADEVWSVFRWYPESKTGGRTVDEALERASALERYWQRPDLPPDFARHKPESLGAVYELCAKRLYRDGRSGEARHYLRRAARARGYRSISRAWVSAYGKAWLGSHNVARTKQWLHAAASPSDP